MLVTTAVDPRYQLSVIKNKLLEMEFKKYSQREARQRGDSLTNETPKSQKPQFSTIFDSKVFLSFYFFKTEEKTAAQEYEQQNLTNE